MKNRIALCFEIQGPGTGDQGPGTAPEWVELLPAGDVITGRDGRSWKNAPDEVLTAFSVEGKDLPIDWEHSSELKAPNGDPAPASGWIVAMENRSGALWGRVQWTERGAACVAAREYRYLSPVFTYDKKSGRIARLTSCGLTNQPNLYLSALNAEQPTRSDSMDILKMLLTLLCLPAESSPDEAMNAVRSLQQKAACRETPSLDKYVPRADYDAAVSRATNAEQKLQEQAAAELDKAINTEIEAALTAGKITPATRDYHTAQCRTDGGLERFKSFVAASPVVAGTTDMGHRKPETGTALNAEEKAICRNLGITETDYLASKAEGGAA